MTQREIMLKAMQERPNDHWPRGMGHVVLGVPGSPCTQKAYHEPGGSFSPSPGSFGVSLWVRDRTGKIAATSDDISINDITQRYVWDDSGPVPALETSTPLYKCIWRNCRDDVWQLHVSPLKSSDNQLEFVIRSVGPAGGPVESLDWDGNRLILNHRWVISLQCEISKIVLGNEILPDWMNQLKSENSYTDPDGWGYARIIPSNKSRIILEIRDTAPQFKNALTFSSVKSAIDLNLPDTDFAASLNAQAANLMMGFIGKQTCPGEPTNYPLAWERDGAYSVFAMARCGQIPLAMQLAEYFAENDYFGGFGSEGDAPGSAINAVVNVARISGDRNFCAWLWPHVQRKLQLIDEMMQAKLPIHKPWIGPIVPSLSQEQQDRVGIICKPAENGLITGAMDHHYPVLYINAMTYRGLIQAGFLAQSLGHKKEATRCESTAINIRKAYLANFNKKEYDNERTFMSGLWPSWIVNPSFQPFRRTLEERWNTIHGKGAYPEHPLWTYFTVAEAHQWLYLGRPDITWKTLEYFKRNQCSPGLHTFWEGNGEENAFPLWKEIRGWVKPPHVTPHYWTAAEMLLLQLDMLVYVDESGEIPELVIGAGVPKEWTKKAMHVKRMPTALGMVDWEYKKGVLKVLVQGKGKIKVRAGAGFAASVKIHTNHHT